MKFEKKIIISAAVSVCICISIFLFRTKPRTQLWHSYNILSVVSATLSESDISSILQESGCKDVVSLSSQQIPIISEFAPVQAQSKDSYLYKRNSFFTDKSGKASVFYIPENETYQLKKAILKLNSTPNTDAVSDGGMRFPFVPPIIVSIFFIVCLYFCAKKNVFIISSVVPVFYVFCNPFYTSAAAVCLFMISLFIVQKIWKRRNFIKTARDSPFVLIFTIAPALILFLSSAERACFFIVSVICSFILLHVLSLIESKKIKYSNFSPSPILSAYFFRKPGKNGVHVISLASVCAAVLLFFSIFFSKQIFSESSASSDRPFLPSPVKNAENSELPDISVFDAWAWNTITFPYRRLSQQNQEEPNEGEKITIPVYSHSEKNGIIESDSNQFEYNDSFKRKLHRIAQNLPYPAIEKVIADQGSKMKFSYTQNSGTQTEHLAVILLAIFTILPLLTTVYCLSGSKK